MTRKLQIPASGKALPALAMILLCSLCNAQSTFYSDSTRASKLKDAITGTRCLLLNRYVGMATYNRGVLSDYFANGVVSGLYLKTRSYKGLQLGAGASAIANVYSSNLSIKDPVTGLGNRYEIGLFDVDRPAARFIFKLEELYLQYNAKKLVLRGGDFLIRTPYINPQDGRLRPNFVQGIWAGWNKSEKFKLDAWYLTRMSPRSTSGWHRIEKTFGMYPQGYTSKGNKANYRNHQVSAGAAIINLTLKPEERLEIQFWDQYVENIFNTAMIQSEFRSRLKDSLFLLLGMQLHYQNKVSTGGNSDQNVAYYEGQKNSTAISARAGLSRQNMRFTFNYLNILSNGRFLMPREWGRDVFYTFMPREKQEGYGRLSAFTAKATIGNKNDRYYLFFGYGLYYLPEPTDFARNKYATPSYQQANFEAIYNFSQRLKCSFLFVSKVSIGNSYQAKYVFNKTDMWHTTLSLQYSFSNFITREPF